MDSEGDGRKRKGKVRSLSPSTAEGPRLCCACDHYDRDISTTCQIFLQYPPHHFHFHPFVSPIHQFLVNAKNCFRTFFSSLAEQEAIHHYLKCEPRVRFPTSQPFVVPLPSSVNTSIGGSDKRFTMNPPRVKRLVGKYELGRTIGEGTFAKVKFARNSETGEPAAIKIMDKDKVIKHKMAEQIKREIATMKRIKHPNVVCLYEVMGSKTKIFIVLEYVIGGELFDKIVHHGRMREDEARRYFQQLINAVDYCHSRGVYHRDLKPENLLLDAHGNLKVSDFGLSVLSQQVRDDGLLHTSCGTPNYVAPEVLDDKGYDGATADLWSCGVILFVLLAGYLPFDEPNLMNLYKKISAAEFTCPPWLSFGARKLISQILDPNPLTRITILEILEDEWFKKDYTPPLFDEKEHTSLDDVEAVFQDSEEHHVTEKREQPAAMNAFELIAMSKGLNLENLFDAEQGFKRETRFTSKCPPNEIIRKIEAAAKPLGFDVHKKNYKMRLENVKAGRKGNLNVAAEVFQVAPSLHLVEVRKSKGDTLEFHKFYKNLSSSLEDVVWKTDDDLRETK